MGHLADMNMNWFTHLWTAWGLALMFLIGGLRLVGHGLLPFIDTKAGQHTVTLARRRMGHDE